MKQVYPMLLTVVLLLLGSQVIAQTEPYYRYVWLPDDSGTLVLTENAITLYDLVWQPVATRSVISFDTLIRLAPDGRTMLVRNSTWEIWDIKTLQTVRALPIDPGAVGPTWGADGSTLTFRDAGQVGTSVYDSQTGAFIRRIPGMFWGSGFDMIWNADRNLVIANAIGYVLLLDPNSGIEIKRIEVPNIERMSIGTFNLSNDGQRIALSMDTKMQPSGFEFSLFLLDPTSEIFTPLVQGLSSPISYILWSEQDSELAAITNEEVLIVDTSGSLLNRFPRRNGALAGASYSQFGGQLRIGYSMLFDVGSNQSSVSDTAQSVTSQFNNLIQVLVPVATLDRFAEIATACDAPVSLSVIDASIQAHSSIVAEAQALESQVAALPDTAIPPGCRADLLAVAAALQAQ
jgi:hypothetical protein